MEQPLYANKEQTQIPDHTFPVNVFYLEGAHSRIIPPHWHEHLEWIAVRRGSFRVQVEACFEDLHAGDVAFVNTRQVHSAFPIGEDSELYAIVFNEALLRNSFLDATEAKYMLPLLQHEISLPCFFRAQQSVTDRIYASLEGMVSFFQGKMPGFELLVKSSLFAALGYAMPYMLHPRHDSGAAKQAFVIQPLLLHLGQHFSEPITVGTAAAMCCVSPNYFCHLFKRATGKTLLEYVNLLRIHEAERLLQTGRYTIQQVALQVGYSNLTYFGRVFRKHKNMTPREYVNGL